MKKRRLSPSSRNAFATDQWFDPTLNPPASAQSPKQVIVLMRHGDRTPIPQKIGDLDVSHLSPLWESTLPNAEEQAVIDSVRIQRATAGGKNAYADYVGMLPWGQLTSKGFQQCKAVGAELRRRYPEAHIQAFSTDFPRTLASAAAALVGFSPIRETSIVVRSPADEFLLPNFDGRCKRFAELLASQKIKAGESRDLEELREQLEEVLKPIIGDDPLTSILDFRPFCVHRHTIGDIHGIDWTLLNLVEQFHGKREGTNYEDLELVKLGAGRLLHWVKGTLQRPGHEVSLLLAHDNMLTAFLIGLGVYRNEWPMYASTVIVEAADFQGKSKVRILVNDEVRQDWEDVTFFVEKIRLVAVSPKEYADSCE